MALADYFTGIGLDLNFGGLALGLTFIGALILILLVFGAILVFILTQSKYKIKIVAFENTGEGFLPTIKDRAKIVKAGQSGEVMLYLRKSKTYRVAYGKRMGKNTYWFAVGDDGYWYNITLEGIDDNFKRLNIKPIQSDMRYAYASMMKLIGERYNVETFWQKYGGMIIGITGLAVVIILNWLLFREYVTVTNGLNAAVEASKELIEASRELLGAANNARGSGIAPA